MTTVAYRNGELAADSRAHNNGWIEHDGAKKVFELCGCLAAASGDYAEAMRLVRWFEKYNVAPADEAYHNQNAYPAGENSRLVIVYPSKTVRVFETGSYFDVDPAVPFMAWGSGTPAALAAMHADRNAVDAVRIAALVDPYTGGAVQAVRFDNDGRITTMRDDATASPLTRTE